MSTVAITGVAGHVGRQLVRALDLHPAVERVVGLDVVAPRFSTSSKLVFRQIDVRDEHLADALHDVDVVVHLAARIPRPHDVEDARSVNVDGARNLVVAARTAGVRRLVHVSSVFAYGAHPDNDLPLRESSPLRATPAVPIGDHAREVEEWLADQTRRDTSPAVTVLRFAMVLGPGMDNVLTRLLESPRITTVRGHRPPLQFLHLDDAVRAIVHAIDHDLGGVFNVSAEGWLSLDEVTAIASKRIVDVPEEVAYSTAERLWKLGIGEHPPGIVDYLMHPWVMSPDAFVAAGWSPHATNRDALAEAVRDHAAYVSLAGARAQRRSVARAILAVVSLGAAFVMMWVWRRGERRQRADRRAEV